MKPVKKIVVLAVIIAAAAAGFRTFKLRQEAAAVAPSATVYSGNIELRRVNLSFRVSGRISAISFDEGDVINAGDCVATLDSDVFEAQLAAAEAATNEARASLERLENGARPQEIEEARAQVQEYEASLTRAESEMKRNEKLLATRAVSESAVEQTNESYQVAKARLAKSREALALLEEGSRHEDIDAARARLAQAKAAQLSAKIALEDARLAAPNSGVMLTRVAEPGAIVSAGQTIAVLSLRDSIWAYIYLEEKDLGRVPQGAKVEIRTDSSDKVYSGRIGYVSPEAEFTPKTVETKSLRANLVYRARVIIENPDDGLRQGMPVDVTIPYNQTPTAPEMVESDAPTVE